jgi:L-serine dehydratase
MYIGCHTEILPGGLNVRRRLLICIKFNGLSNCDPQTWLEQIRLTEVKFRQILKWVSCFALSVNEVNAALGRIVTAPTNGSRSNSIRIDVLSGNENHNAGEKKLNNSFSRW